MSQNTFSQLLCLVDSLNPRLRVWKPFSIRILKKFLLVSGIPVEQFNVILGYLGGLVS